MRDLEDPSVEARFAAGGWTRADAGLIKGGVAKNSAIYDAMGARTEGLRAYKVFAKADGSQVTAVATFGDCCVGHPGVVHGGVTSLIFDNTLGFANAFAVLAEQGALDASLDPREASKIRAKSKKIFGFTASLTVNFRKPVFVGTTVLADCKLDPAEGRQFLHGTDDLRQDGRPPRRRHRLFVALHARGSPSSAGPTSSRSGLRCGRARPPSSRTRSQPAAAGPRRTRGPPTGRRRRRGGSRRAADAASSVAAQPFGSAAAAAAAAFGGARTRRRPWAVWRSSSAA